MNNFIFICEEGFKEIILQAVILATLLGDKRKDDDHLNVHESYKD